MLIRTVQSEFARGYRSLQVVGVVKAARHERGVQMTRCPVLTAAMSPARIPVDHKKEVLKLVS